MAVFVDTSALYSLLVADEKSNPEMIAEFARLLRRGAMLVCTSYVVIETIALLQRRIGLPAVQDLEENVLPALRMLWVGEDLHRKGLSRLFRENRRRLSLVDCVSLEVMEAEGLRDVLGLDSHFAQAGFRLLPTQPSRPSR